MGSLGPMELLLIFLAILLIFGAKRIPEIARGLGKGIREFKEATREITQELDVNAPPRIQAPRPPAEGVTMPRTTEQQTQPVQPPTTPSSGSGEQTTQQ